ncbi:MAG: WXG100 family type VII secretion target [Defluviitaleaceae bacterium]|nr:WXG100 family type VII secretion target [Defluviitaleaceae bacterium]
MQNNVRFDFAKSQNLSAAIKDGIKNYTEAIREVKTEIASMGAWWDGDSHEGFNEYFDKISPAFTECENAFYKLLSYLQNVSNGKNDLEKKAKKRF